MATGDFAISSAHVSARSRDATPSPRRASTHLFDGALGASTEKSSPRASLELTPIESKGLANGDMASPPVTPVKTREQSHPAREDLGADSMPFDFSKIDYELARARRIGQGLWSKVWLADAKHPERRRPALPTPPSSPPKWTSSTTASSLFAVKIAARPDAAAVFVQETKVLTHMMRIDDASQYVVTFHGLDFRNSALVFEAVIGGSLEGLNNRLKQMTEVSRHLELVNLFPGLASDLVSGLEFLHEAGVVHADIKPANILLDISDHINLPKPVVRARYIDFSAAFRLDSDDSTENSGGTWDYMAPEQLRLQKELNTPTFASDVWSLGISLLSLLVGDSPYTAACSGNLFMLREAIKTGDPLSFARVSPTVQKRMSAAQDFVDCCRVALQKDRQRRPTASAWKAWLENHDLLV
ncbi:hypothetical protein D0868_06630 [Hortaea werneckii]|uniref:mitogen-activated protein kinase kinase n=1 Tax=Hortaea werneckii TaxID=91943 RepID=A0A3M6YQ75_HORWE|nr:hypothetical protein D0868_06630 [Hortaea werneckii]